MAGEAAGAAAADDTIFNNPESYTIKHPLEKTWVLWFDNPNLLSKRATEADWEKNLQQIYTIRYVEDFWAVYNHIKEAEHIPTGSNYHLFLEGIKPMWEDPSNRPGGKWVLVLPPNMRKSLNQQWMRTMLAIIGEQFGGDGDQICGAVISNRKKSDKLALWTRDAGNEAACRNIGVKWKELLALEASTTMGYQGHEEAMRRGSSFTNSHKLTV